MLAHAAYRKCGGTASVSVALWSPDGTPPADMGEWEAAAKAAPPAAAIEVAVREALVGMSVVDSANGLLLRQVPKAHTSEELTALLEGSSDPSAAQFLAARSQTDKTKQKELKAEMAAGKWEPLLSSLGGQVDSSPPFDYPNFPMSSSDDATIGVGSDALTGCGGYLCLAEFLHFDIEGLSSRPPPTGPEPGSELVTTVMVAAEEAGGLRAGGV